MYALFKCMDKMCPLNQFQCNLNVNRYFSSANQLKRNFPKPCYFRFFLFSEKTVLIHFFLFKLVGKQNDMHLIDSPGLTVHKKFVFFSR